MHPHRYLCAVLGMSLAAAASHAADCARTSVGLTPISELGSGLYLGEFAGGLYPTGDSPPPAHANAGLARAALVRPLTVNGVPSQANGRYVLLSIGMSNTTQEYCGGNPCRSWTFGGQAAVDTEVNHNWLRIVDGAAGGQTADTWDAPTDANYERIRTNVLQPRGLSEAQVQVVWVKVANRQPAVSLPDPNADAYLLLTQLGGIARALRIRYPNLQVMFVSSRIYAGYASTTLNPEPYAYESGFAAKWLIEAQIRQLAEGVVDPRAGDLDYTTDAAPWIAWGPYLWADGTTPRDDGLTWVCGDLEADGTHPSLSGEQKVGAMLLDFMKSSPFARPWFTRPDPPLPGDLDGDEDVDLSDLSRLLADYGCADGGCNGDIDGDGDTDLTDLSMLLANFGR